MLAMTAAETMPPSPVLYVTGDATQPEGEGLRIIAHIVNDANGWGAGFVVALSKKWARPEAEYRRWMSEAATKNVKLLGAMQFVPVERDIWVANIVGQHGMGRGADGSPPIRYEALSRGLSFIAQYACDHPEKRVSVHAPRLGCGLAGASWSQVEPLLDRHFVLRNIPVTIYDWPGGTFNP